MNELRMMIEAVTYDIDLFWRLFAMYMADFLMIFLFAHRLFNNKKYSVWAAGVCAAGGAVLFAFIGSLYYNFHPITGMFFNCGIVIFLILALLFIYKDKPGYKTAYVMLYVSVFTTADIILMDLLLSFGVGRNAYFYGMGEGMFMLLFCVSRRIIGLTAAGLVYYILRRISAEARRDTALLNFIALILFWFVQLFGVFSAGKTPVTPQFLLLTNSLLGVGIIIVTLAMLNTFPKFAGLLRKGTPDRNVSSDEITKDKYGLSPRETQKLRHDVKNNIATISALIDNGDKAEAKRLLGELGERLASALGGENETGISTIDTTVSQKAELCKELSVTLDIHAEPLPETKIPSIDLSSVISNILDNAIEAAQSCEEPVITLRIFKYKSYLAIICENPVNTAPLVTNGRLATAKDGAGHGYGVEIISDICKNNNGRFQYEFDNKKFKASAFLEL